MKIVTVVGARPNFMKAAPLIEAIRKHNQNLDEENGASANKDGHQKIDHVLVHTGQHYDSLMSESFFTDLGLPVPDVRLSVGSGSHAVQTAAILSKFEEILLGERPDVVVVVGDVNSTVACALATSKIAFDATGRRPLLAHVEAGLRSFDRMMPEEVNRVVTDHVSDLLFVTEPSGIQNLRREGLPPEAIHFVGNTMIDSLLAFQERAESSPILEGLGLRQKLNEGASFSITPYAVLTVHRPSNVDDRKNFLSILGGLDELAAKHPIVFPVHPRTQRQIQELSMAPDWATFGFSRHGSTRTEPARAGIVLTDPLGYLDFLCLMKHASIVITDSGGIQEETTCLGVPCVTVRDNTERPVTIQDGTNVLGGTDSETIRKAIRLQLEYRKRTTRPDKWDGRAADRILQVLIQHLSTAGTAHDLDALLISNR